MSLLPLDFCWVTPFCSSVSLSALVILCFGLHLIEDTQSVKVSLFRNVKKVWLMLLFCPRYKNNFNNGTVVYSVEYTVARPFRDVGYGGVITVHV